METVAADEAKNFRLCSATLDVVDMVVVDEINVGVDVCSSEREFERPEPDPAPIPIVRLERPLPGEVLLFIVKEEVPLVTESTESSALEVSDTASVVSEC